MRARAWVVAALVLCTGCGVPTRSTPDVLASVPYGLTESPQPVTPSSAVPASTGPRVWLVRGEQLVAATPVPGGQDARSTASEALARLAAGPTDQQRTNGLSTALGSGVRLTLMDLSGGRATVDISSGDQVPSPGGLPRAVGQVVLTLTSVDGIESVVLISDGQPVQAPLPGGELTDRPLTVGDYETLQAPQQS